MIMLEGIENYTHDAPDDEFRLCVNRENSDVSWFSDSIVKGKNEMKWQMVYLFQILSIVPAVFIWMDHLGTAQGLLCLVL